MDIDQERSIVSTTTEQPTMVVSEPIRPETVVVAAAPVEREILDVRSVRTVSFPSIAAGLLAVAMLVLGGVLMARGGIDDSLDEPLVTVAGIDGTAVGGIVLLALGLGLLFAAFSGQRGAILFLSVLTGVAAAVIAIEPEIADGKLGFSRGFAVVLMLAAATVALIAALAPTMRTSHRRVAQI